MENERLSKLVEAAKGDRSIREYAADSGVNPTTISKIISKGYTPSSGIIKKLGSLEARPQGNVTIQDLMIAAGFTDVYYKPDMPDVLTKTSEGLVFAEVMTVPDKKNTEERGINYIQKIERRFEAIASGVIYNKLAKTSIMYTPGQNAELDVRGYRPDMYVRLTDCAIEEWWFDFKAIKDIRKGNRAQIRFYTRVLFRNYLLIVPDRNRKLSIVIDDEEVFDEAVQSYKEKTSYRGDLSIILIDTDEFCVLREEYIAFYDLGDNEDKKLKLV